MNLENFTQSSSELINKSIELAQTNHNPTFLPLHILSKSLDNEFCLSFYQRCNLSLEKLRSLVHQEIKKLPTASGSQLTADPLLQKFFDAAKKESDALGDEFISLEHFLIAWTNSQTIPDTISTFFKEHNFNKAVILELMNKLRKGKKSD